MSAVLAWFMGSKLARYVGGALLIVAAVLGFRAKWKGEGRQDEQAKQAAKDKAARAKARKIERDTDALDDDDRYDAGNRWL